MKDYQLYHKTYDFSAVPLCLRLLTQDSDTHKMSSDQIPHAYLQQLIIHCQLSEMQRELSHGAPRCHFIFHTVLSK